MYTYQTKIKLHETDAAGLLFFSNQFKLIHDAYESLLESLGLSFQELIRNKNYFLPIVHAESD
ncbi:MAG: acyl-CoA thioesterase, partial [Candidatus Omnitrophica bacterium]|nr:acyl-CoA thioesterase [Candidatus Omnitrophota bacterium]